MAGCYSLTPKEFQSEFEHLYVPRIRSSEIKNEVVITGGADRRQRIDKNDEYPHIGLLRMDFCAPDSETARLYGTATMIADGSCVLTCAHNVVEHDVRTNNLVGAKHGWFELRKNKEGGGSVLIKRYEVTKIALYPPYLKSRTSESGFDLAPSVGFKYPLKIVL